MLHTMKTVTIRGGGLAGLALGIALRARDIPVTIHERDSYPRHKVCGEFITGLPAAVVDDLGIADVLAPALRHKTTTWFRGDATVGQFSLPEPALGVSRYYLDAALWRKATGLGCTVLTGIRREALAKTAEGLVDAVGPKHPSGRWIGLKVHLADYAPADDLELHVGRAGYAGVSRIEKGRANLCGLFRIQPGLRGKRVDLLASYLARNGMTGLLHALRQSSPIADTFRGITSIGFTKPGDAGRGSGVATGPAAIGDAWRMIPPFTGNGMAMAIESGTLAAPFLADWSCGKLSWDRCLRAIDTTLARTFAPRLHWANATQALLLSTVGRLGLTALCRANLLPFQALYKRLH